MIGNFYIFPQVYQQIVWKRISNHYGKKMQHVRELIVIVFLPISFRLDFFVSQQVNFREWLLSLWTWNVLFCLVFSFDKWIQKPREQIRTQYLAKIRLKWTKINSFYYCIRASYFYSKTEDISRTFAKVFRPGDYHDHISLYYTIRLIKSITPTLDCQFHS